MINRTTRLSFSLLCILILTCVVQGQQWTRFRGPNGQGISQAKSMPVKWTEKDFNWKVKLPAGGHSSPVIWKDKLFITCENPESPGGILLALDVSDGHTLWKKQYKLTPYKHHNDNNFSTATPAVNADHVYILWQTSKEVTLAALDHSGHEIWQRNFPGIYSRFGPGTSPLLFNDFIVFSHEHWKGRKEFQSSWIALDRKTGQTRWTKERDNSEISYSTPCVYSAKNDEPLLIFTSWSHGISAVEPQTGTVIWEYQSALPSRVVSSPVVAGDLIIGTCGKGGAGKQLSAVRISSRDNSKKPELIYTLTRKSAPYVPTPLAKDGLLFTYHDQGDISCLRLKTGEVLWCEKPAGRFYGSPVWVNGLLYCIDRKGDVIVLKAAPKYELLAVNSLGEGSQATPAIADGRMYLRTYSNLISIGNKAK
ncbi:MAG: PQQ-binding-like beta-propeller repeat protein [Planctomycetes bacterium]|nr:PQQ-binding-like beta-propeller repeat protein [Planctomycetota bacterium]